MLYLLDANSLITAKNFYYPIPRFPDYWEWLVHAGNQGQIKIPSEIYNECSSAVRLDGTRDDLATWASDQGTRDALIYPGDTDIHLDRVIDRGYGQELTEDDLLIIGKDPWLISTALVDPENTTVVTTEVSRPKAIGRNRKIPDVCRGLGIKCIDPHKLICELDFYYHWKSGR